MECSGSGSGRVLEVLDTSAIPAAPVQSLQLSCFCFVMAPVSVEGPRGLCAVLKVKEAFLQSVGFLPYPGIVQHNGVIT